KRSRWIVPAVIGATAVVGVAIGFAAPSREARDPCPDSRELATIWDPARRVAIQTAFAATRTPYQADTFARVAGALDRASTEWVGAQREACRATHGRHEQYAVLLDRRMRCLREWRRRFAALVDGFASATP